MKQIKEILLVGKKPTYKQIADYLGVTEQTVKQYSKEKRELFKLGLWAKKSLAIIGENHRPSGR